jgi:maleate isomerase
MYGWRGKIGLIIPSLNNTMEPEFNQMVPNGVAVYATRVFFDEGVPEQMTKMAVEVEKAADLLKTADMTGIVYGCTTGSLINGIGSDLKIISKIKKISSVPATTAATAVIEAFKELKVKTVAVATPYIDDVNRVEKKFFEAHGIRVINIQGLNYTSGKELHRESPETAYIFAKQADHPKADCIFISCTDFATIRVLNLLEQDLGKPVISSNTASLWAILRKMGIKDQIEEYGEILRHL